MMQLTLIRILGLGMITLMLLPEALNLYNYYRYDPMEVLKKSSNALDFV